MRFAIICSLVFVLSCEIEERNDPLQFKVEKLSLSFDSISLANPGYIQLIETDTSEVFLDYNGFKRRISFYKFPSAELLHGIYLEKDGEHAINMFRGFKYTNSDTIWVVYNPPGIGLLNFDGKITARKRIVDDRTSLQILMATPDKQLYKYRNKIFGTQPLFMDHHGMDKNDIDKYRLIYSYNFETDSVEWYEVYYPSNYWDLGKKMTNFSWTRRGNKLYVSPWYDHEIQVFDMETGNVIERKQVKSIHVNRFLLANQIPSTQDEGFNLTFTNDQYTSILYDKYRDLFYRLFIPSFDIDDLYGEFNFRELMTSRPNLGLMVLDRNLNIIGEHIFDRFEIYTSTNHFVGKEGLYLSMNNVFNPEYNEDKLRYLIFTPELENR